MIALPSAQATDEEVAEWVRRTVAALDVTPRDPRWRHKALGMTRAEAVSAAPLRYRLDLQVPVGEMRVLRRLAERRGLGVRAYVRRLIATALLAVEGLDADDVPSLCEGGLIRPERR